MMRSLCFVVLVGCWRGSTPPPAPAPEPTESRTPRRAPPPDAEKIDEEIDEALMRPPPPGPPQASCPSGTGVVARVVGVSIHGNKTVLLVSAGSIKGITSTWTAELTTQPPTPAQIDRIDPTHTRLSVPLTPDQIKAAPFVVFCPP